VVNLPLTVGWLPVAVQVMSAVVLVAALGWRSKKWLLLWVPIAAMAGLALVVAAYWFIRDRALADDRAPVALWLWIALTGLAVVVAIAGWRRARWWHRGASLTAIPSCLLCAALVVDSWTGYLPTLGAAWNRAAGVSPSSYVDEPTVWNMVRHKQKPAHGTIVTVQIPADASGFRHRIELVYLPPAWFVSDPPPQLPAVVMVDGEFGNPTDWPTTGGAQHTADEFAAAHGGNAPILVFVDISGEFSNDTECVNGVRGNAADHLTKDVVPYIVSHFGVSPAPERWGMVGWSSGGTCALLTTVMHPEEFSTFVDIDGLMGPNVGSEQQTTARLFGGDADAYAAFDPTTVMTSHGPYTGVAGWFAVGGSVPTVYHAPGTVSPPDGQASVNEEDHDAVANDLCSLAGSVGIECAVVGQPGSHDFGTAAKVFAAALPWLASRLGTPAVAATPLPGAPGAP
jgi:S-formylglutathione hydrolase FrmB